MSDNNIPRDCQGDEPHLAVDEFQSTWTLCVAVASTILGTSLITRVLGHPTVRIHLYEVESGVETAHDVGQIDVEGELLVLQLEHVVRIVVG